MTFAHSTTNFIPYPVLNFKSDPDRFSVPELIYHQPLMALFPVWEASGNIISFPSLNKRTYSLLLIVYSPASLCLVVT